jgi:uncharacterized protein (DUF1778 family)
MTHPTKPDAARSERLELRMRADEKATLERAAALGGEDVSSFVRRTALTEARLLLGRLGTDAV